MLYMHLILSLSAYFLLARAGQRGLFDINVINKISFIDKH